MQKKKGRTKKNVFVNAGKVKKKIRLAMKPFDKCTDVNIPWYGGRFISFTIPPINSSQ